MCADRNAECRQGACACRKSFSNQRGVCGKKEHPIIFSQHVDVAGGLESLLMCVCVYEVCSRQ